MEGLKGGGINDWPMFYIKDTGSAYAIRKIDDSAAATALTDAFLRLRQMEATDFQPNDAGQKLVIEQYRFDKAFTDFKKKFVQPPSESNSDRPEVQYLDGEKVGGAGAGSGEMSLIIGLGPKDPTDGRYVNAAAYTFESSSGGVKLTAKDHVKSTITANSVKLKHDLVIPKELFNSSFVTISADITIPAGTHMHEDWHPAP